MKDIFKRLVIKPNAPLKCRDYKKILDYTRSLIDYDPVVTVTIADIRRGMAYYDKKKIILPTWLNEFDMVYQVYCVIHELVHCMIGYKHSETFKKLEDILLSIWGIEIVRMRVYPKRLFLDKREIFKIPGRQNLIDSSELREAC
ncbi:hypothetical protein A2V80_02330 [Candidatus Woesebacteria bacterium RBG_16_39_8b]|uniref:WLM domain-containing protein n=1 Tax=Candidatus Woesebacteria bacterium RBG_16_39_8b TaxID=1802482 RepID=A0A1F7XCE0_9BACT|nr:MAG: hypothetical protein A2V80_02330 [Candidatus Woesebacteria bacterium RBG_16_39_8b]